LGARAHVLGAEVDRLDMQATVQRCRELVEAGGPAQHVCVNAAKLVAMQRDERLRRVVARCQLVSADGQAIVWAARLLRQPLPERVAGIDLMHELLGLAEREGWRVYFLGARREVLDRAVTRIRERHPRLEVAGARDGYFTADEDADVCEEIRAAGPHLLFVAMSSPRKEYWLGEHVGSLGVPFSMGVGGALDIEAGVARRAPVWMQRAGLEWLFRLLQDPRRLLGRYIVGNMRFLALVLQELARPSARREPA
jgi:N-acetylglucosaminyldiphosphoundecaprenol N-acetyl-beta-D-mannosaminyltransferase